MEKNRAARRKKRRGGHCFRCHDPVANGGNRHKEGMCRRDRWPKDVADELRDNRQRLKAKARKRRKEAAALPQRGVVVGGLNKQPGKKGGSGKKG